jgi:hypothetical protein
LTTPFRDPSILQLILHEISAKKSLCAAIASQAPEYFEAMLSAVDDPTIFRHPESAEVSRVVNPFSAGGALPEQPLLAQCIGLEKHVRRHALQHGHSGPRANFLIVQKWAG